MRLQYGRFIALLALSFVVLPGGILRAQVSFPPAGFAAENGDVNGDLTVDISDGIHLLGYLFTGGPAPVPLACGSDLSVWQNGDTNADWDIDVSDGIFLLGHLYMGGPAPVGPCDMDRALGLTAGPNGDGAGKGNPNPGILPIQSKPFGKTYGEWSAEFWKWSFALPVDHHPLFDTEGCAYGQSGKVWFLGASFSPSTTEGGDVVAIATRDCTVPPGTALFFPIANAEASTIEGCGTTWEELSAVAESWQDPATNLSCEIDGVPVKDLDSYRVQSPLYTFGPLPENSIPQFWGLDVPAGTTSLSVADGVQLMLAPLSAGTHTIHFHAEVPDFNFYLDITYNLTVGR